jgi:hypothetical protein
MSDSITTDAVAHTLAHGNLIRVFSNRDPGSRLAAIKDTYHPDVTFYEPDAVIIGHEGINERVEALLNERQGWAFEPAGNVLKNHDMVYLAWGFGPKGEDGKVDVKARGADVLMVQDGKVKKFWVVLEGVSDVKV